MTAIPSSRARSSRASTGRWRRAAPTSARTSSGIVDRLLGEQLPDGGWNCEAANGSTRSSFNTTICVLEALLEYELAGGSSAEVTEARLRGQEYLLERRLFRRRSTGEVDRDRKGDAAGRASPSRPGGTTTCCGDSSTCAEPAPRRTSAWPRRSSWSSRSATATAGGRSRTSTPARCRSRWTRARAGRAGGTRCAPYGCWTGIQHETNADAAGRGQATSRTGPFSDTTYTKVLTTGCTGPEFVAEDSCRVAYPIEATMERRGFQLVWCWCPAHARHPICLSRLVR